MPAAHWRKFVLEIPVCLVFLMPAPSLQAGNATLHRAIAPDGRETDQQVVPFAPRPQFSFDGAAAARDPGEFQARIPALLDRARNRGADPHAQPPQPSAPSTSIFARHGTHRYWISGQSNVIFQAHPAFHSPYQGPNSFGAKGEYKASVVNTLYLGYRPRLDIRYNTDFILDVESAGGRGLSNALGLAGFTNLDVVRNPNLGITPYLARGEIHQTIGFTNATVAVDQDPLDLAPRVPVRRLDIRVGKMSLPDSFDVNPIGSDSHSQFVDWTVDQNGAWDYAADTRGYTVGGIIEYDDRSWSARYGIFAMPTVANGMALDWAFSRANGQNMEFELRKSFIPGQTGATRILGFVNHAHMGDYRQAVIAFFKGIDPTPEITKHEHFGAVKYGFGWNNYQSITSNLRIFSRFGWNEGEHESYVYTEDDQTFAFGGDYRGTRWGRPLDKLGVVFNSNAIKKDHQNYLKYGGLGFILGDGRLNYRREQIFGSYYNVHVWSGVFYALGLIHIDNPGYNRDRGPVWVPWVRMHIDW